MAINGVMPLPALTNRIFGGGGSGSAKSPLGVAKPNDRSRFDTVHEVRGQEALRRRLDGDRDELACRARGTEVSE